jgi:hypothetical protein
MGNIYKFMLSPVFWAGRQMLRIPVLLSLDEMASGLGVGGPEDIKEAAKRCTLIGSEGGPDAKQ